MHHHTYDIRHRLLQADTKRLLHRNAPHRDGDRNNFVLFNKDLNYKGTSVCARSTAIRAVLPMDEPQFVQTREGDDVAYARAASMDVLRRTRLPAGCCGDQAVNHPKYGDHTAHLLSFDVSQSCELRTARAAQGVYTRETENAHNRQYAVPYRALCAYLDAFAPGMFGQTAIYHAGIIYKNSQCVWHTDKSNIGHAALTALGEFKGDELLVEDKPANGTQTPHFPLSHIPRPS